MSPPAAPLILCCEDEPQLLRDICDELREAGYRVAAAAGGAELLTQLESCTPDLLLCDIMMPGVDGFGVLAAFRRDYPHLAHVPLIFLTALSMTDAIVAGKRAGADDYLTKPINYDLLLSTIEARLRQTAQARKAAAPAAQIGQHLFEALSVGVLAHDARGRLTQANPAARRMLGLDDAENGACAGPALQGAVRQLAEKARAGQEDSLSLALDDTGHCVAQVHACPADPALGADAAVLVFVTDLARREPLSPQALRDLFGLTPTEARVARHLAAGLRPEDVARKMGVAGTTIAFHLRNVFGKTGTNRQAELVALLLSLPLRETG